MMKSMQECFGFFAQMLSAETQPEKLSVNLRMDLVFNNFKDDGMTSTFFNLGRCFSVEGIEDMFKFIEAEDWSGFQALDARFKIQVVVTGNIGAEQFKNRLYNSINDCQKALRAYCQTPEATPTTTSQKP